MTEHLLGRVAAVTGGGSGIGSSIAEHLARAGHHVAVLDLNAHTAVATAAAIVRPGVRTIGLPVDVADRVTVESAYARVRAELGPISIVVTSAAISPFTPFEEITLDHWTRTLAVNLTGTFNCIQAAIGDMIAQGWGRIVTISSVAGQTGVAQQGHYSASKAGVIGLTRALAVEYAARGITVNTIPPFVVDTPGLRAAQSGGLTSVTEAIVRAIPAGRLGTGDDIAAACRFLCSDDAGYITGQVIAPNGGGRI